MSSLLGAPLSLLAAAGTCLAIGFALLRWNTSLAKRPPSLSTTISAAILKLLGTTLKWSGAGFALFWLLIATAENGLGLLPSIAVATLLDYARYAHAVATTISNESKLFHLILAAGGAAALTGGFATMTTRGAQMPRWVALVLANRGAWQVLSAAKKTLERVLPLLLAATLLTSDIHDEVGDSSAERGLGRIQLALQAQQDGRRFADLRAAITPPADAPGSSFGDAPAGKVRDPQYCKAEQDDRDRLCANLVRVFERIVISGLGDHPAANDGLGPGDRPGPDGPLPSEGPPGGSGPLERHRSPTPRLDGLVARDVILRTVALRGRVETPPAQETFGLRGDDREIATVFRNALVDAAPRSVLGADVAVRLEPVLDAVGPEGRRRLTAVVKTWLRSFNEVMDGAELGNEVVKWAIGSAVAPVAEAAPKLVDLNVKAPDGALAKDVVKKFLAEGGLHFYKSARDRYLSHVLAVATQGLTAPPPGVAGPESRALGEAAEAIRRQLPTDGIAAEAAKQPPVLREVTSEKQADALLSHLATLRPQDGKSPSSIRSQGEGLAALASVYQDEFPGRPDDPGPTPRQRVPPDWMPPGDGGRVVGLPPDRPRPPDPRSLELAQLTRSFEAMSNYGRVGGVVIGQTQSDEHAVGDLEYNVDAARKSVSLTVTFSRDPRQTFGPYDADLARRALAYAADGRVVAATIVQLDDQIGEVSRRALVHPALQGAAVGRAVLDMDKWVFDVALNPRHPLADHVAIRSYRASDAWMRLYRFAFAAVQFDLSRSDDNTRSFLARFGGLRRGAAERRSPIVEAELLANWGQVPAEMDLARGTTPPWKSKSSSLPTDVRELLVDRWLEGCVADARVAKAPELRECLARAAFHGDAGPSAIIAVDRAELPRFTAVSGVRQRAWGRGSSDDPTAPFDFIVQYAFPIRAPMSEAALRYGDAEALPRALVLSGLEEPVTARIRSFVAQDPDAARTLAIVRDFTELQQIFRSALSAAAPLPGRLVRLSAELARFGDSECPTARWDSRSSSRLVSDSYDGLRQLASIPEGSGGPPPKIAQALQQCAVSPAPAAFVWSAFSGACGPDALQAGWRAHCKESTEVAACDQATSMLDTVLLRLRALSLRQALDDGVQADHAATCSAK